jgi:hypothetical protein
MIVGYNLLNFNEDRGCFTLGESIFKRAISE